MKTISMPYDEYKADCLKLKSEGRVEAYTSGALDTMRLISNHIQGDTSGFFNNNKTATEAFQKLMKQIYEFSKVTGSRHENCR